jgi:predicted NUDIX family NTP pyrophosphohydrolase
MRENAGVLVWRISERKLQILLVHQANKHKALWSIPKGAVDAGEDFEKAARREVEEETGVRLVDLDFLGYVDYGKANKRMYCYMGQCPPAAAVRNRLPEIDNAGFFDIGLAKKMVDKRQRALINVLQKILAFSVRRVQSA